MSAVKLSRAQANLQLALLGKQAEQTSSEELYVKIQGLQLPAEISSRLHSIIQTVKQVAGKAIQIGKIVLLKIIGFVQNNQTLVKKVGVKLLLSAAVTSLIGSIPYIGPLLKPIAQLLKVSLTNLDANSSSSLNQSFAEEEIDLLEIARSFFKSLIRTLNTVIEESHPVPA